MGDAGGVPIPGRDVPAYRRGIIPTDQTIGW